MYSSQSKQKHFNITDRQSHIYIRAFRTLMKGKSILQITKRSNYYLPISVVDLGLKLSLLAQRYVPIPDVIKGKNDEDISPQTQNSETRYSTKNKK